MKFPLFLAGLILSIPVASASACRGPFLPFDESLAKASLVFVGRVVSVAPAESEGEEFVRIRFEVERVWKGRVGKAVEVLSATHSCGFARGGYRAVGEKWLILASGEPLASTSMLSGNVWLELEDRRPTDNVIPKSLKLRLGNGKVPARARDFL